jgi:acetate CoA/acetoacetate CoA-transferase alpha subunit
MVGGFMAAGAPHSILEALVAKGSRDLTVITNDAGIHDPKTGKVAGVAHLIQAKGCRKVIGSHIGLNAELQRQMNAGETEVELRPQGTLAEQIRAAGAGLGGFLTPTGLGTEVEIGKQVLTVDGRSYLLELPLGADIAIVKAKKADKGGNLVYAKTAQNFNPLMASAARMVIAEAEEIVEIGEIDPEHVRTPGIFVDFLVKTTRLAW